MKRCDLRHKNEKKKSHPKPFPNTLKQTIPSSQNKWGKGKEKGDLRNES